MVGVKETAIFLQTQDKYWTERAMFKARSDFGSGLRVCGGFMRLWRSRCNVGRVAWIGAMLCTYL
jgi:hypothetical protein